MSMEETIRGFPEQFGFEPEIMYKEKLSRAKKFVVGAMGGSGHSADLLTCREPTLPIYVHRNYDVPDVSGDNTKESLFLASSYSGNTEEPLDFLDTAFKKRYAVGAIGTGGKLISFADKHKIPHIVLPDTGIEPRSASGFSIVAMAALMGLTDIADELRSLKDVLKPETFESQGNDLAASLEDHVPIIYASERNRWIANNWKIKFNETSKIPAYYDVFPELNHNEINGFDHTQTTERLAKHFHFIFLSDVEDTARVQKRFSVTEGMYEDRGLSVTTVSLEGSARFERMFNSLLLADWTTFFAARNYGVTPEGQPMVEEFKKLLEL